MIAASGERQQFVVPAASFGNVRNVAPQGLSAAVGRYRPRAAVTAGRRWSPPSATAGAWAAAAPSTPAFWCPPVPRTGRRGFSQPQRCAQRFDRRARVQRQLRGREAPGPADHGEPVGHAGRALVHEPVGHLADGRLSRPAQVVQAPRPDARILPSASQTYTAGVSGSPRPWAPFPQPIPPAACPARKASATARRCPGTGASPAPRSACPWPGSQHGHAGAIGKPVFPDAELPLGSASASTYVSKSGNSGSVGATPTPSARSSATASARASPGPTARSIRRHRSTRCRATRASTCPPTGVRKAACRRTGGAGLGGGRGWRGGVLAL